MRAAKTDAKPIIEITQVLRAGNGAAEDAVMGATSLLMEPLGFNAATTNVDCVEGTVTGLGYTVFAKDIDSVETGMVAGQVDGADDFVFVSAHGQIGSEVNEQTMHKKTPVVTAKKCAHASEENTEEAKVCMLLACWVDSN